jgi:hypothetical protein
MSDLNQIPDSAKTLPTGSANTVGQLPSSSSLPTSGIHTMSTYPSGNVLPTGNEKQVGAYGSAAQTVSMPGLDLADIENPPHIIHNSVGSITMRAFTSSGKYGVDWGDGTVSSLDYGSKSFSHSYGQPGWKRVRFMTESGDLRNVTQLWPGNTGEAFLDARTLPELESIQAYEKKLLGVEVDGLGLLSYVKVDSNLLSAFAIDHLLVSLDRNSVNNGALFYSGNPGSGSANRSVEGAAARANLISKGWTITV